MSESPVLIGLIGDYHPHVRAHSAIPAALKLTGMDIDLRWVQTSTIRSLDWNVEYFDGLWCVPGSPYADMQGALDAIRAARELQIPFLGTCGGFQHAVIEFARNVLGLREADHEEENPSADLAIVSKLSCSLVGKRGTVQLIKDTKAWDICGDEIEVSYHCNYGMNSAHAALFSGTALRLAGVDLDDQWRIIELDNHPFFMATLFQPELDGLDGFLNPIIRAFATAAQTRQKAST